MLKWLMLCVVTLCACGVDSETVPLKSIVDGDGDITVTKNAVVCGTHSPTHSLEFDIDHPSTVEVTYTGDSMLINFAEVPNGDFIGTAFLQLPMDTATTPTTAKFELPDAYNKAWILVTTSPCTISKITLIN